MNIDEHFHRLEGKTKDVIYWKNKLLSGNEIDKKVIFDSSGLEIINYDSLKCIELQNQNGLTPAEETSLLKTLPPNSNECFLIYLSILLKRQKLPILCQKARQMLESKVNTATPSPIRRRIELLTGKSTINSVFEEDDLLVLHLLHSDQILVDFDKFAELTNYRDDLVLDFMLYDCENANFLQVMLKIVKQKCAIQVEYPELNQLIESLVLTLRKCKNSLIYDPQVLINYWERK
jgi:hypothetical protein